MGSHWDHYSLAEAACWETKAGSKGWIGLVLCSAEPWPWRLHFPAFPLHPSQQQESGMLHPSLERADPQCSSISSGMGMSEILSSSAFTAHCQAKFFPGWPNSQGKGGMAGKQDSCSWQIPPFLCLSFPVREGHPCTEKGYPTSALTRHPGLVGVSPSMRRGWNERGFKAPPNPNQPGIVGFYEKLPVGCYWDSRSSGYGFTGGTV